VPAVSVPWLRPWKEVAELYRKAMRERERREREALAAGINCRLGKEKT
jgi:hypothetical protein